MAYLVWRSGHIGNDHGQSVLQEFFYTVSPFCLFGIQPIHRLSWSAIISSLYSKKFMNGHNKAENESGFLAVR